MKYTFLNPCQAIRDYLTMKYGLDLNEETIPKIFEDFDILKYKDYDKYKLFISVLYTDYYVLNYLDPLSEDDLDKGEEFEYDKKDLDRFTSVEDVIDYIDENPSLLTDMIYDMFRLDEFSPLEKRENLNKTNKIDKYLLNINAFHLLDKLDYCYEYDKDEIILRYQQYILTNKKAFNNEVTEELKIYTYDYIEDFLAELDFADSHNYKKIVMDIVKDCYIYNKYESKTKEATQVSKDLIDTIEYNSIKEIIELTRYDDCFLNDMLPFFFEFNEKDDKYKKNAIEEVSTNSERKIKRKVLRQPIK